MKKDIGPIKEFVPFKDLSSVRNKVWKSQNQSSLKDFVHSTGIYRFTAKAIQDHPDLAKLPSPQLDSNAFKKFDNIVFFAEKPQDGNEYLRVLGLDKNRKRVYRFIRKDYINDYKNLNKYKVIVPRANGSGALGETLSTPLIGQPLIGHTGTFICIGSFATQAEAEACLKYVKSKFARVLLGILKVTQHNTKDTWKYVPWQDFSSSSDIDWTQSIPDIDRQLYAKYGLSDEEIQFIESHVKEME